MRVLIGCEFSGVVREAFAARGHNSWSCDLKASLIPGQHYQCNILNILHLNWDLLICFPPCTDFSYAGSQYFNKKILSGQMQKSLNFVRSLWFSDIDRICLENPRGLLWKFLRRPDQVIQPYQFGHPYRKYTCLWLKNLRLLMHTSNIADRQSWVSGSSKGLSRSDHRSLTFKGIAEAMADQWNY